MRLADRLAGKAAFAAIVLVVAAAGSAVAVNDLGHRAGSDSTVTFRKYLLTATFSTAFDYNDTQSIEVTDISTTICVYLGAGGCGPQEVNVYDANYGNTGWFGYWTCQTWIGFNNCGVGNVVINLYYGSYYTPTGSKSLTCEEVGHSVGLAHSTESTSCMSQDWADTKLTTHDKSILNNRY